MANRAFRDPSYASILRAYSGTPLIPGQDINLMQTLSVYNKARDYTPYERFMRALYNSLNPDVQTPQPAPPPPPKHHHESFWDELIGAIVSVVVMIVVPEAVGALAFDAAFSATGLAALNAGQLAVACAVGGALSSVASQGVAIAFDDQHGFSVQSMIENAIASGATAGISKAAGIQDLLTEKNPEYIKAFAESVGINATVQAFQLAMGLRDKLDVKLMIEQATATVLQGKIDKGLRSAPKSLGHLVDEFENTSVTAAFTGKVDLTSLAGNYLGDEAGDGADLIANHIRQSHHTTSIGKSSKPSRYSDHARADHTASRYVPGEVQGDDGIGDLYGAYQSGLQGDVNEMAESQFNSALLPHQNEPVISHSAHQHSDHDTGFVNWLSHEVYDHQHSLWARGIMGFAGMMNSNTMNMVMHGFAPERAMDPTAAIREAYTGRDPLTGEAVSELQAYTDASVSSLVFALGGELDSVANKVALSAERMVSNSWASLFWRGGVESPALDSRAIAATHVREARNILKEVGLTPAQRNEILYSFDLKTFRVEHVLEPRQEYRLFDDGAAELQGRYVSPHFIENQTDRIVKFALPKNSATRLGIVNIPEDAIVFSGRVAPQLDFAPGLVGGETQTFLLGPLSKYRFEEILMPRNIIGMECANGNY